MLNETRWSTQIKMVKKGKVCQMLGYLRKMFSFHKYKRVGFGHIDITDSISIHLPFKTQK